MHDTECRTEQSLSEARARPKFLIIGAQKAGTVSLYRYLAQHPQIVAVKKEIGYFDQDVLFRRGPDWYHRHFPLAEDVAGRLAFEATPESLYYPTVPERLAAYDPGIKLIALLREPVARALSAWNMFRELRRDEPGYLRSLLPDCDPPAAEMIEALLSGEEYPAADAAMTVEIESIERGTPQREPGFVQRGLYADQLQRFLAVFDRRQLAIIPSARLESEPVAVLDELTRFLELPAWSWRDADLSLQNVGSYDEPIPRDAREQLRAFFRPHNERLYELLGYDLGWDDDSRESHR
jgi:hypothetical protein